MKGYVGMSEEQKRRMVHCCHVLVWVYGYNDYVSFRDLMDKTPARYTELAQYLDKIVCNQIATIADVSRIMQGRTLNPTTSDPSDADPLPQRDTSVRDAKICLAVPPPLRCFPCAARYSRLMYLDLADLTQVANLHKCQATCHKYNHANTCR
ncbi:unnamed protein product [Scytosiphon promiscuus]